MSRTTKVSFRAMAPEMLFDYLGVRVSGPKAAGKKIVLNVDFTDLKKQYALTVKIGVFNYREMSRRTIDASLGCSGMLTDYIKSEQRFV